MKLPLTNSGSASGNSFHPYNDQDEIELDIQDDISNENSEVDFTEYEWMENEEEFDKLEMERLEVEALMEACMNDMQADEFDEFESDSDAHYCLWHINSEATQEIYGDLSSVEVVLHDVKNSKLNPLAKEFVPSSSKR